MKHKQPKSESQPISKSQKKHSKRDRNPVPRPKLAAKRRRVNP